jgi:hypothetical protein
MEITEKERLMLVEKKAEIRKLTEEILEPAITTKKNEIEIKKKVTGILSLLSTIASYSDSKNYNLEGVNEMADSIFSKLDTENYTLAELFLEAYCNTVNSIRFDFTKKNFRIVLPKIKNLNVGSITNK